MNIFTPSYLSLFRVLAVAIPIFGALIGGIFGLCAYYVDKNLPIKYKRASEINSQLDNYINPVDDNVLWRSSEFFKTVPIDHLTDEHQKRINEILSNNLDNRNGRYSSLMHLMKKIYSPENDILFKAVMKNNKSYPSFVQHHAFQYFLGRETDGLNLQLLSLIHHPKYTSPKNTNFKLIDFLSTSVHLSDISNSAAIAFANNEEVINELINVQDNWFEKYEEYRINNLNKGVHTLDIDGIIRNTYLAEKIEEMRNQIRASEKSQNK